jgi:hypothetical protein
MRSVRYVKLVGALALSLALVPGVATAQFGEQQKWLGGHLGLSGVGSAAAIGINGELAYNDRIGIGAWLDTWSYGDSYTYIGGTASWDIRYTALAATGAYHFPVESHPRLDPFAGLALGYYIVSSSSSVPGANYTGSSNRVFLGGFGGVRYFFKENLSGVARAGFGASYLTVGVDFKL